MKAQVRAIANRLGFVVNKRRVFDDAATYATFPEASLIERRFYNIGAGAFRHPYWTNIDYATEHYRQVQKSNFLHYDLMALEPLPLPSNSAELIYSSHTIEHVTDDAVRNMLRECYRVLKPGGGIRLTTPDAALGLAAYQQRDRSFWYWVADYSKRGTWENLYKVPLSDASIEQLFLHHYASQLCEIDIDDTAVRKYSDSEISEFMRQNPEVHALEQFTKQCRYNPEHPGNHVNWWTHEKVTAFLQDAGFAAPYRSGFGQSLFAPLRDTSLFDSTHPAISLYVEAVK
jgi:predicted SAM-dependent methyltransferase